MAVYTFLEETDLSGKTIIPFVTSGGSGFSGTIEAIEELQPEASVLEGLSISGSQAAQAQEQVGQWPEDVGRSGHDGAAPVPDGVAPHRRDYPRVDGDGHVFAFYSPSCAEPALVRQPL